jgi:nickel transport protein
MRVSVVVVVILLAGPAWAHDLWLEKEAGGFGLYYGHKHSTHEGAQLMEYRPDWVKEALCLDEQGARNAFEAQAAYPYHIRGDCAAAYVLTSSGYWTKTPYGTENVPKAEARMAIRSWLSFESVKRLDRWSAALAKPLTQDLEITSLNDPLTLHEGDKLRLVITFEGRPVDGAVVAYDGKPRGQSGADGAVNVRIQHGGFQVVQASLSRPDASGKADEVVHTTNLNFELPEK